MIFKLKKQDGTVITKDAILDGVFLRWDGLGFLRFDVEGKKVKLFIRHNKTEPPDPEIYTPPGPDDPPEPPDEFSD